MNRLEMIKRAILSVSAGIKNLLSKDFFNRIYTLGITYERLPNGFSATALGATGGYGRYVHSIMLDRFEWGKTYTITCNAQVSLDGMTNLMRVGYFRSDTSAWKNIKHIVISTGGLHSLTVTLPDTQPELFMPDTGGNFAGLRLFFNVQTSSLEECGTLTVTDIVVTENE